MLIAMILFVGAYALPAHDGSGLIVQGPYDGRFEHVDSSPRFNNDWKWAQSYCVRKGRHATIVMDDEPGHAFAFHCYRKVNIMQMWLGDDGR